jgi:hypothetical protein
MFNYAIERFRAALQILEVPGQQPREQLIDAYCSCLIRLQDKDLPQSVQHEFKALRSIITRVSPGPGADDATGAVMRSVQALSDSEVLQLTEKLKHMNKLIQY